MKYGLFAIWIFFVLLQGRTSSKCGCKTMRKCYEKMLESLRDMNEAACIQDAAMGTSTMLVYFRALKEYCNEVFEVKKGLFTHEHRSLYEVILDSSHIIKRDHEKVEVPVIIIEAGQLAGTESMLLALYVIEQLVACKEYEDMTQKARWVILPCTNPDGLEYNRFNIIDWVKNVRPADDNIGFGVDISRNFDAHWGKCPKEANFFSDQYPGPKASSENETIFIKNVINNYKNIKAYLSIKRNGHGIFYPYAYSDSKYASSETLSKIAGDIATKVNTKAGAVQIFVNNSIFNVNGAPYCGHSVDYAVDMGGIKNAFEMRVFFGNDIDILSNFQSFPKGFDNSLLTGYFNGIRELYNIVTKPKTKT